MTSSSTSATIAVKLLFFAKARELCGLRTETLHLPIGTTAEQVVLHTLPSRYPSLVPLLPHVALALNQTYLSDRKRELNAGDELALIPPISGG